MYTQMGPLLWNTFCIQSTHYAQWTQGLWSSCKLWGTQTADTILGEASPTICIAHKDIHGSIPGHPLASIPEHPELYAQP